MNEIKIQNYRNHIIGVICSIGIIAIICAGIIYYYRGTSGKLESELDAIKGINSEIASESRQLQAGIASHSAGIKRVRSKIGTSRERIEYVYSELVESAENVDRTVKIIEECENIIKAIKAQR